MKNFSDAQKRLVFNNRRNLWGKITDAQSDALFLLLSKEVFPSDASRVCGLVLSMQSDGLESKEELAKVMAAAEELNRIVSRYGTV